MYVCAGVCVKRVTLKLTSEAAITQYLSANKKDFLIEKIKENCEKMENSFEFVNTNHHHSTHPNLHTPTPYKTSTSVHFLLIFIIKVDKNTKCTADTI